MRTTKLFFSLSFFTPILSISLSAQTFFQTSYTASIYGTIATGVIATRDSGYLIVGSISAYSNNNALYAVRANRFGDTLWSCIISFPYGGLNGGMQYGAEVAEGGFLIGCNITDDSLENDIGLVRLSNAGDTLWTREYNNGILPTGNSDALGGLQETGDGGFIVGEWTMNNILNRDPPVLMKLNSTGDTVWTKVYRSSGENCIFDLQIANDGGFILSGYSNGYGTAGFFDALVMKTDFTGTVQWAKMYGGRNAEEAFSARQIQSGGYMFTGYSGSWSSDDQVFLGITDSVGNLLWSRLYGVANQFVGYQTPDNGYLLAGDGNYATIFKTDPAGNVLWAKEYDTLQYSRFITATKALDGGVIAVGEGSSVYGFSCFIKSDSIGNANSCIFSTIPMPESYPTPATTDYRDTEMNVHTKMFNFPVTIGKGGTITDLCSSADIPTLNKDLSHFVNISPNPNKGVFTVFCHSEESPTIIEIYNVLGEKVYSKGHQPSVNGYQLNLSSQPNGIYLYRVITENGDLIGEGKVIIEK